MEDKKENSPENKKDTIKKLFDAIEKSKKIKNAEEMKKFTTEMYESTKKLDISTIQKFIILFYGYYNRTTSNNKYEDKLVQLSNFMLRNFAKKSVPLFIKNEINKLFPDFIIDSKNNEFDEFEICFILCKLPRNIKLMRIFFNEYLKINIFEPNEYIKLELDNPNTRDLFEDIFKKVYNERKNGNDKEDITKDIISTSLKDSYKSKNNLFRCKNCYDIMNMKLNKRENIEFKCQNCDSEYKELKDTETLKTFYTKFFCSNCERELLLYKQNYKCTSCKKLLCINCKIEHLKKCFSLRYIKMHEVGFKCEIHNENYIEYCFTCEKNLCEKCKIIHQHVTKVFDNKEKIDKLICNKQYNKDDLIFIKNEMIKHNLTEIFKDLKEKRLFNGFLYIISCALFKIARKDNKNDISLKQLNNNEFLQYYSKAIRKVSDGKLYYLKHLKKIRSHYTQKKPKELDIEYDTILEREIKIKDYIEKTKSYLTELKQIFHDINYNEKIYSLKKVNSDLLIKIEKLNFELLEYRNSNRIVKENTHNILCRFLADELLNNFIQKYPNYMDEIKINLYTFLELISSGNYEVLSNKEIINSISKTSNEFNDLLNNFRKDTKNEESKTKLINFICSSKLDQIQFIEDIKIENNIYKKEDLNAILDLLFLIKKVGNKTAHPNIELQKSLKIINMLKLLLEFNFESLGEEIFKSIIEKEAIITDKILIEEKDSSTLISKNMVFEDKISVEFDEDEDQHLYYNLNENETNNTIPNNNYNLFNKINQYIKLSKSHIEETINNLKNSQISRFNIGIVKKNAKVDEIFEAIFNEKDENLFEETQNFIKILSGEIDNVIKKDYNTELENNYKDEKENIKSIMNLLEVIRKKLKEFDKLKIIRHENLDEHINQKILADGDNYSEYISYIDDLESRNFSLYNNDSLGNEIIAEICFLFLNKIFFREINRLEKVINNYEKEIFKNIIYDEITNKLKEIQKLFEKHFKKSPFNLTKLLKSELEK